MAVLNTRGYYDAMDAMLRRAVAERFLSEDGYALYETFTDIPKLVDYIESYRGQPQEVWKEKILEKYDVK